MCELDHDQEQTSIHVAEWAWQKFGVHLEGSCNIQTFLWLLLCARATSYYLMLTFLQSDMVFYVLPGTTMVSFSFIFDCEYIKPMFMTNTYYNSNCCSLSDDFKKTNVTHHQNYVGIIRNILQHDNMRNMYTQICQNVYLWNEELLFHPLQSILLVLNAIWIANLFYYIRKEDEIY